MDITGTLKLVTESGNSISSGDIIAIIVAVISLAGVIISTFITNKTTKKINADNSELQEKWNQKNIDANLIAQARIEWIQNVRKTTAELLVHYFAILTTADINDIDKELLISQEKNELLILYFGNEKVNSCDREEDKNRLLCVENNNGKNDLLVSFLIDLSNRFSQHSKDIKNEKFKHLSQALKEARNEMYNNATYELLGYDYTEEGDEIPVHEPVYDDYDRGNVYQAEKALRGEKIKIESLQNDLIFLRNIIRTYLKIEWSIAKKGQ